MRWVAWLLVFLLFPVSVWAATSVSFTDHPAAVDENEEFEIAVTLMCTGCTSDSYLRTVFYPSGTNYFGYTKNNDGAWVNASGGSCTQYFKVTAGELVEGSWSGKLGVKPDSESSAYAGPGDYLFKVGRYTGSCGSPTWSGETTITVTGPTPTATPTPTPTPQPTAAPQPTNTPTPTIKPAATVPPTRLTTPTYVLMNDYENDETEVLGGTIETTSQEIPREATPSTKKDVRPFAISFALVGLGLGILTGVFVWQKKNAILEK